VHLKESFFRGWVGLFARTQDTRCTYAHTTQHNTTQHNTTQTQTQTQNTQTRTKKTRKNTHTHTSASTRTHAHAHTHTHTPHGVHAEFTLRGPVTSPATCRPRWRINAAPPSKLCEFTRSSHFASLPPSCPHHDSSIASTGNPSKLAQITCISRCFWTFV
jgi:hypothetical protein